MNTSPSEGTEHPDRGGKIFRALYSALQSEGVDQHEACRLAERGAQLLIALGALPPNRWEKLRACVARMRSGSDPRPDQGATA